MNVLLVTRSEQLAEKLAALNPELEYCAIVVDEVEPAKEVLKRIGLAQDLLHPINELKPCVEITQYDYAICVANKWWRTGLAKAVRKCSVPKDKVLDFWALHKGTNFLLERSLRYFKEHVSEFEMFATGISTVEKGLDVTKFKRKLFNFGRGSQDLYYNFQVAKFAVLCGGGDSKFRYALIGLVPYTFHYDLTKTEICQGILLQHFIVFNDVHNFFLPVDTYKKFFREEWWKTKLSLDSFNIAIPYGAGTKLKSAMDQKRIDATSNNLWLRKYYPETRDENIKILDDYLTFCEENNIRAIMFRVPVTKEYMTNFNPRLLDEFYVLIEQTCKKHPSAIFVDGWKLKDFMYADFHDHEHLNINGAAKFSAYLNDFIDRLEKQGG